MSKILVVTFTNTVDNYGQVLQYYATQEFLSMRGHDVYVHRDIPILDKRPTWRKIASKIKAALYSTFRPSPIQVDWRSQLSERERMKQELFDRWEESISRNEKIHPRNFNEFKSKYFHFLKHPRFYLNQLDLDACVVGSDQTWSTAWSYYYLEWAPKKAKRIAIAPSVGHKHFTDEEINQITPYIQKFDLITVREQNGLDLCLKAGYTKGEIILDPCFLLSSDDYFKLEEKNQSLRSYLLIYLLGGEIGVPVEKIYQFAKQKNLDVIYIASQGREDEFPKNYAKIGEWLSLIRDAKYVFTNSFHGMAFSIIYHKQFLTFPLIGIMKDMNGRIQTLAEQMKLQKRIFQNDLTEITSPIDYSYADDRIKINKELLSQRLTSIQL